jgi:hypothetical protein
MGPCVDGPAVAEHLEDPRLVQLSRRVGVEGGRPGQDHAVIDQAPQVVLGVEELFHGDPVERIPVRQDIAEGEEQVGTAPAGVAEQPARRSKATQGQTRSGEQAVGVQHADEGDVHEESLYGVFLPAEVAMVQVPGDDAGIVGPVPRLGRRPAQEPDPARGAGPAHRSGPAADQQLGLPGIAQEALVDGPPPRAPGPVRTWRSEDPPFDLPVHEGQLRPAVGPDARPPGLAVVEAGSQLQAPGGIVSDSRHHRGGLSFSRISGHPGASCRPGSRHGAGPSGSAARWPGDGPRPASCPGRARDRGTGAAAHCRVRWPARPATSGGRRLHCR